MLEGKLVRDAARLVRPPEHTPRGRDTWTKAEVRRFPVTAWPGSFPSPSPVCEDLNGAAAGVEGSSWSTQAY